MNGLPENFDASVFIGRTVEQVCVSVNTVSVYFGDDLFITISAEFSLGDATGQTEADANEGFNPSASVRASRGVIARLAGATVVRAAGERNGTLTIECDSGDVLHIYDTPLYEAYVISHRGEDLIV